MDKYILEDMDGLEEGKKKEAIMHIGYGIGLIIDHYFDVITDSDWFIEKVDNAVKLKQHEERHGL